MHMFPFQREYRPETGAHTPDEEAYYARMQRFATGKGTADALAMTALIAQYSGSGRDAAAGKAGLTALSRYHGMPSGAFSADPFLAGRDPAGRWNCPRPAPRRRRILTRCASPVMPPWPTGWKCCC